MVIEYAGIVIRAVLTDKREKFYDSKVTFISQKSLCCFQYVAIFSAFTVHGDI